MTTLTHVGTFCPVEACPDYGKVQSDQQHNIKKAGKTKKGRQRYQCKTCKHTFVETKGTILYRRRTPEEEIMQTLAFVAEGVRVSSLARVKGHKEDTISVWLKAAAEHAEAVEEVLMADYQIERGQLDALWSYVGNKGEKRATPKPSKEGSSGGRP